MRRLGLITGLWLGLLAFGANAGIYTLTDGTHVSGDPMTYQQTGIVFKQGADTYSAVVPWNKFSEDALKQLLNDATTPSEKALVEPMIVELPANNSKPADIAIKPVALPVRPTGHLGVLAIFSSPVGWVILLVLYGANIFAAYEVALFRNRPFQTVCGYAAIPFFGIASPIYFIAMPTVEGAVADSAPSKPEPPSPRFATAPAHSKTAAPERAPTPPTTRNAPPAQAAETVEDTAPEPPPSDLPPPTIYQRGDFSFNRRFFETKLAAYFRVVLGDAEKDTVIYIKSSRGDFIGKRISRITANDLSLQIFKEGATADEMIPFLEIMEVQIRHKDLP